MVRSIVIADDHAFTLEGMKNALENSGYFSVVGEATNAIDAVSVIRRLRPDCAVLDLSMPGGSGIEVLIETRRWSPDTRVAIVTGGATAPVLRQVIEAGADGLFLKTTDPEVICSSLVRICDGAHVIGSEVSAILENDAVEMQLTPREVEVLHGLARGLSNVGISEHLGLSAKTIDSHRTRLMRKFEVNTTATLLVKAMRMGLLDTLDEQ